MRPPRTLALALALGTLACSSPFPCNRYCWSHKQVVADVTGEDMPGVPDGYFDMPCTKFFDTDDWHPPLPTFGWYAAERCVEADVHEVIARTVATIQDPAIDATAACDVTDLQIYADFVQTLAQQARDACVAHLSCNGAPAGCDIDPTTQENEACTVPSAQALCDQTVLAPALAALTDLTNAPGAAQPQRDGTTVVYVQDPLDCTPILQADTDGTPACDEPPPADDGLDESSSSGSMLEPFGDIDALVTCKATTCAIDPELFLAVQANFGLLHDEGLQLEPVDLPAVGRGLRLSGLDPDTTSGQLLAALGLANGDVITHVDDASILSPTTLEHLMRELPTTIAWRISVHRSTDTSPSARVLTLTRGP
ncbi:hypothetical protein [Paraliomyxa miuraensis]|uniref:hypothetical protein n=1 Tax=Paraliomyxa miuraensis TaxID=376150 RepID=UPI002253B457|nr:hypothetical protein [Paraliomyxa miuraensis]MCX4247395.1 hypothetical protein [Paraliomyxa miuraensis]